MPKITKRLVDSLKPNDRDLFVWDSELKGFGVRMKPSGAASFFIQYRMGPRTRRYAFGRVGVVAPEKARQKAQKLLAYVQDGGDPSAQRKAAREAETVADLAERYLDEHAEKRKRPRSIASDKTLLRLHVLPHLGALMVAEVSRADVHKLHHYMRATPGAANRTLALLSKMLNLAERWGMRPDGSNPCRHVEKYPERKMERFLSGEELARLGTVLSEAERTGTELQSVIAAIRLLVFTGCRLSEVLTMRWEYVDCERGCLWLPESKTGAKVVHLNAPALAVLKGIKREDGSPWVIAGVKQGSHLVNLRKPWYRIRKSAGIDRVRIHDLRHSFASVAAAGGLSLHMIGTLLGHTQMQTTARYAHLAADPVKAATERVGAALAGMMSGNGAEVVELPQRQR